MIFVSRKRFYSDAEIDFCFIGNYVIIKRTFIDILGDLNDEIQTEQLEYNKTEYTIEKIIFDEFGE